MGIKHLKLIPSDFDSLDTKSTTFDNQYADNFDCPIARALKRRIKAKYIRVGCQSITIDEESSLVYNISFRYLRAIASKMKRTGRPVILKLQYT